MTWRKNKLKEILARGEVALGTCIYTFSPALVSCRALRLISAALREHAWRQDERGAPDAGCVRGNVPLRGSTGIIHTWSARLWKWERRDYHPHVNTAKVEEIVQAGNFRKVIAGMEGCAGPGSGAPMPGRNGSGGAMKKRWC
jgi:hypothetical protein